MQSKCAGIHDNRDSSNHQAPSHRWISGILSNRHTYQGHMIKTRKGVGSRGKKVLNYGKQERETANENVAGTQYKGPCNKACKCENPHTWPLQTSTGSIRERKQPRQRRQQKPYKFAYLTIKNSIFARFARAFFIFWHFVEVLVLSTTWNHLFCSCVDDVSISWQMFNFVLLCPKRWFQFNSRIVRTRFSSIMTLNNWKMIAETRSYIFRCHLHCRRCCVCLSSLLAKV